MLISKLVQEKHEQNKRGESSKSSKREEGRTLVENLMNFWDLQWIKKNSLKYIKSKFKGIFNDIHDIFIDILGWDWGSKFFYYKLYLE